MKRHLSEQVHVARQRCNLCAINAFKARPHPPPPTHPHLPAHFSIFPFLCSSLPVFPSSQTSSLLHPLLRLPVGLGAGGGGGGGGEIAAGPTPVTSLYTEGLSARLCHGVLRSCFLSHSTCVYSDNQSVLFTWLISSIPLLANSKTSSLGWTAVVMAVEASERSLRISAPNALLALFSARSNNNNKKKKSSDPLI